MRKLFVCFFLILLAHISMCQKHQDIIMLNGIADYEQTETAFPPEKFGHRIAVPGLIDEAEPKPGQYERYFSGRQDPKYHWYRFVFKVPSKYKDRFATLVLLKSMFNTQVILNGYDCGTFMQCSTPVETNLTPYLRYDNTDNVLLVRLDEEKRIPPESAMGFDREKFAYIPGIWDDVFIDFTGPVRIARTLILPRYNKKEVTVKLKIDNLSKILQRSMEWAYANYTITGHIEEKRSGKRVTADFVIRDKVKSQMENINEMTVPVVNPVPWSPENPLLYRVVLTLRVDSITIDQYGNPENKLRTYPAYLYGESDVVTANIGMRDFTSVDNYFALNGERYFLTGSGITLNRFFEDRDRKGLPWDREWVKKLFIQIPKSMGWNTMRVSIGLLPRFWYDLADEYGIMLQNEYPMWQYRGSDPEIEREYTDWVWADGCHPSIVIWDALNEQKSDFIGNRLIPELLKLDPTRIWDAGDMTVKDMRIQMDEDHLYNLGFGWWDTDKSVSAQRDTFRFGAFQPVTDTGLNRIPSLVNEFGWIWQTRDGSESAIRVHGNFLPGQETPYTDDYEYYEPGGGELYKDRDIFDYFLGPNAGPEERFQFQAYYLAAEAEALRASKTHAGVLSFPYLTNNRGYTGDWWLNSVAGLKPSQSLLMQYHTAKLFGVYINQEDQRYNKHGDYFTPGTSQTIRLFATNESGRTQSGKITLKCLAADGRVTLQKELDVIVAPFGYASLSVSIKVPERKGGYMLLTELTDNAEPGTVMKQVSRRYIRVGNIEKPAFYNYQYRLPDETGIDVKKQFEIAQQHYTNALKINRDSSLIPRSTKKDGSLFTVGPDDWCSGFFAGSLWYLYEFTKDPKWKEAAARWTAALEGEQFNTGTHDLGFMLWCSFGNGYRLTENAAYKPILIQGARSLSTRFKPIAGVIRSWDFGPWMCPVIIDNMMNLEFLLEASRLSGEPGFKDIAISHADHDMPHHFRPDHSSYHLVDYDTLTGQPRGKQTYQGKNDSSAWARGQAWGLYGFTTMYRYTKNEIYLRQAEGIAKFILTHPNLPEDKVPYWDFDAPGEERDASAAAIMASALLELSTYSKVNGKWYRKDAEKILRSLSSSMYSAKPGTNNNFILMHSVGAKPPSLNFEVDSPLNYADYYYLEALIRYDRLKKADIKR